MVGGQIGGMVDERVGSKTSGRVLRSVGELVAAATSRMDIPLSLIHTLYNSAESLSDNPLPTSIPPQMNITESVPSTCISSPSCLSQSLLCIFTLNSGNERGTNLFRLSQMHISWGQLIH